MVQYKFTLNELRPVTHIELSREGSICFWFKDENPDLPPRQWIPDSVSPDGWQEVLRPYLTDTRTLKIYNEQGEDACIRYINTRIANYLLDEFERVREACPVAIEKKYLSRIDEFYEWFWKRRQSSNEKIFSRFLQHLKACKRQESKPQTWFTVKEAATYIRSSISKVRQLIDQGKLKSHRLDDSGSKSTILIHRQDLDALILFDRSTGLSKRELDLLKRFY
ncbi:MAG: helix-turn-helix domain-containing protein [Candidatus Marinimicrobia bacterium]|nr:helix-turn-helix domain-containing protein [Candidatus Neomarinimicrobiota bacterium]